MHAPSARQLGLQALTFDPGLSEESVPDFPHIEQQVQDQLGNHRHFANESCRSLPSLSGTPADSREEHPVTTFVETQTKALTLCSEL